MALVAEGTIEIPDSVGTSFDHGAFEPETKRVFIAHTARDSLEVVDVDTSQHLATLRGFPEAAGVVAGGGSVLVTNRCSASLAWVDARTFETRTVLDTGSRPNGVAIVSSLQLAGVPDATFFNPKSGLVHVAIGDPGLIQSVDPHTGASMQFTTATGAKTTAFIEPDQLYVFSPLHKGIRDLRGA